MFVELIKPNSNINFIGNRFIAFAVSGALIIASILSIVLHKGLNLGVDFRGGLLMQVRFSDQSVSAESLRLALSDASLKVSSIQNFGGAGEAKLFL